MPITAPPLAVVCWTLVTAASSWSMSTLAPWALAPALAKALAKSSVLTAKAASTLANLLTTSVVVIAVSPKLFTAAVNDATDFAASMPERRVKIMASLIRFNDSSAPRPCRANSTAPSATVWKLCPVFCATWNRFDENATSPEEVRFKITFTSANVFSTSIALVTIPLKAFAIELMTPTAAPKARVRATEASRAFWNSPRSPVIRPSGWRKPLSLRLTDRGRILRSAVRTSLAIESPSPAALTLISIFPLPNAITFPWHYIHGN